MAPYDIKTAIDEFNALCDFGLAEASRDEAALTVTYSDEFPLQAGDTEILNDALDTAEEERDDRELREEHARELREEREEYERWLEEGHDNPEEVDVERYQARLERDLEQAGLLGGRLVDNGPLPEEERIILENMISEMFSTRAPDNPDNRNSD